MSSIWSGLEFGLEFGLEVDLAEIFDSMDVADGDGGAGETAASNCLLNSFLALAGGSP